MKKLNIFILIFVIIISLILTGCKKCGANKSNSRKISKSSSLEISELDHIRELKTYLTNIEGMRYLIVAEYDGGVSVTNITLDKAKLDFYNKGHFEIKKHDEFESDYDDYLEDNNDTDY